MTAFRDARVVIGLLMIGGSVLAGVTGAASLVPPARPITLDEVRPVVAALGDAAPSALRAALSSGDAAGWLAWLTARQLSRSSLA